MHEHDQELIMALAEGTLDDAATSAAQAEIQTCPECTQDLELQRLALTALDETPAVYMTATESARLHDALKREVVGAKTPPVRAKQGFAWGRWLPAAGIAAVFLAVVVSLPALVGGMGFSGDSDDAAETTAAATESRAEEFAMEAAPEAGGLANADASTETTAAPAETTAAPETTEAMAATDATTTTVSGLFTVVEALPYLGTVTELDLDEQLNLLDRERRLSIERSDVAKSLDESLSLCVINNTSSESATELGIPVDSEPILVGIVATVEGEELVLVAYVPQDLEATVFVTQQLVGCEVVEILPF